MKFSAALGKLSFLPRNDRLPSAGIYSYVLGVFGEGNHAFGWTKLEEEPLKA